MLSYLRFEFEKFAVQVRSNVVDKNHMEKKNSIQLLFSAHINFTCAAKYTIYRFIKYIKAVLVRKCQSGFGFVTRTSIRSLLLDLLLIENIKKLL